MDRGKVHPALLTAKMSDFFDFLLLLSDFLVSACPPRGALLSELVVIHNTVVQAP